jgi:hypothetical protein
MPDEIQYDASATPAQFTNNADIVIEHGTHVRVKIIGLRTEVGEMWAIGSINGDFLGYGPVPHRPERCDADCLFTTAACRHRNLADSQSVPVGKGDARDIRLGFDHVAGRVGRILHLTSICLCTLLAAARRSRFGISQSRLRWRRFPAFERIQNVDDGIVSGRRPGVSQMCTLYPPVIDPSSHCPSFGRDLLLHPTFISPASQALVCEGGSRV